VYERIKASSNAIKALEAACWRNAPETKDENTLLLFPRLRQMLRLGQQFGDLGNDDLEKLLTAIQTSYVST
jgi:hypothetical protein